MKCPKCNEEIADNSKFCTKCGANIEEAKKELEEKKALEEAEKTVETQATEIKEEKKTTKKEKKTKQEPKKVEKTEEAKNEEKSEEKTEEAPKKKSSKKKIFIIISIIIVLLAGAGAGTLYYLNNQEDTEKEEKVLEWGDVYLEILNDDEKIENMDKMKIALIDLDQDKVPELVIQGTNNAKESIATVYKINDKNKVDTLKILMDEEFTFKLVYDLKKDKYVWYAVAKEKTENPEVYDLNIETGKYKQEKLDINYKNDLVIVETEKVKWTDFTKELSKKERKEKFEETKKEYIETEELITDEIKEKVELAKSIRDIEKIDSSKEIVYTVLTKKDGNYLFEYPCINIKSADVEKMNAEIKEKYGFEANSRYEDAFFETEEISYSYSINDNILSLLVWRGGNESIWANTYNVDLKTSKEAQAEELIKQYEFKKDEVITKSTEAVEKEFNSMIEKEKTALGENWDTMYGDQNISKWKPEISKSIEELNLFVNENNELCILGKYQHGGGQWSCWQTVIVNISNGYKLSELSFKDGTTFKHYVSNYTPEPSTSPTTSTTPSPSTTTNTSTVPNVNFIESTITVPEGTYERGNDGTIKITNSKAGQFDFEIECTYMTSAGYPNLGMVSGTAKATDSNSIFAYTERKSNGDAVDYNIIFTIADGETILIDEQYDGPISPYCGHNVTLEGTFKK